MRIQGDFGIVVVRRCLGRNTFIARPFMLLNICRLPFKNIGSINKSFIRKLLPVSKLYR
jgi:hypothetical protein